MMKDHTTEENRETQELSRRKALTRLGLAAGVAYAAPTIVHLDRASAAKNLPSACVPDGSGKSSKNCK
jgi:hypothetical protein